MLWEIIFEMLGELFKAMGEILQAFWALLKSIFGLKKDATEEDKKKRRELLFIIFVLIAVIGIAFMFPGVRKFVFGGGGARMVASYGPPLDEKPRNQLPMGQYTSPQLYKQKRTLVQDDDGVRRYVYYYIYEPRVPKGELLPLVVVLHGRDGTCPAAVHLRMGAAQKEFPSYILIPQSPAGKVWDTPAAYSGEEFPKAQLTPPAAAEIKSIQDVIILLAKVTGKAAVDVNRIYIVGCDDGAGGVYGALANYPGIFAAGVAIAGKWSFLDRKKLSTTPLLILHGSNDKVVPPAAAANLAQVINAVGGKAAYHEFPGVAHDCESPYFYGSVVWKWLFAQVRPEPELEDISFSPGAQ